MVWQHHQILQWSDYFPAEAATCTKRNFAAWPEEIPILVDDDVMIQIASITANLTRISSVKPTSGIIQ